MEPYYLTTPIYYVNSTPHIGHAYTTIAADVLVRHQRQRGRETFLLTGVDEHASKVARVAERARARATGVRRPDRRCVAGAPRPPRRGERLLHPHERRGPQALRPGVPAADPRQRPRRRLPGRLRGPLLRRLRGVQDGGGARRRQVPRARHRARVDRGAQLVLPALGLPGAAARALRRAAGLRPPGVPGERGADFIAGGLQDFSISRAGQPWGIPIPWDPEQVAYVWADALVNYLSALTYARPGENLVDRFWPAAQHLLGEGHPPLPLRLLAGDAARGRLRRRRSSSSCTDICSRATARSRSRSATSSGPARPPRRLRGGRDPLLVRALRLLRAGRHRVASTACASATSASSETISGTSSRGSRR